MILIEKTDIYGWEAAIRGMRNPKNSWDMSDSGWGFAPGELECYSESKRETCGQIGRYIIGEKDRALMKNLASAGNDHGKYLRMITVTADLTAPLYWWKEFDTYKVGTVTNSCSTMHKIHVKEFVPDDFSSEHLLPCTQNVMAQIISNLNTCREMFIETKDKTWWWQMIQLLPSSYNQKRTVLLNYMVLRNMYHARKTHKLDEWRCFCAWIEQLPHSELITG